MSNPHDSILRRCAFDDPGQDQFDEYNDGKRAECERLTPILRALLAECERLRSALERWEAMYSVSEIAAPSSGVQSKLNALWSDTYEMLKAHEAEMRRLGGAK